MGLLHTLQRVLGDPSFIFQKEYVIGPTILSWKYHQDLGGRLKSSVPEWLNRAQHNDEFEEEKRRVLWSISNDEWEEFKSLHSAPGK